MGTLGTDVQSPWYQELDKPAWQPPGAVFGPVWTTLYGLITVAAVRVMNRTAEPAERHAFGVALGGNLVLNASWNWLFFTARRPRWALAELGLLAASSLDLVRRASRRDTAAATMLGSYAAWVAFATALNAGIARRNPAHRH